MEQLASRIASAAPAVALDLHVGLECWRLRTPFRTASSTSVSIETVVVTLADGRHRGRGEAIGVDYLGDDVTHVLEQIETVRPAVAAGITREQLQGLLPPGGARNALDCAFWELEAQQAGKPAWQLAQLRAPRPLLTTCTVGAADPATMAAGAQAHSGARAIKLKLTGEASDAERVRAVRAACPHVWLGVDANQGFTPAHFAALLPTLLEARVELIEQPFGIGSEPPLAELRSPIPIAADESAQSARDLPRLVGRFDLVNIKLDKCGGLTEALRMADEARALGLGLMVGNMLGTSLAMAPAFLVGQLCQVVDLDGPLLLARDRPAAVSYEDGHIQCSERVWGGKAPGSADQPVSTSSAGCG